MREYRSSGSVEGVASNRYSYSDPEPCLLRVAEAGNLNAVARTMRVTRPSKERVPGRTPPAPPADLPPRLRVRRATVA